MKRFLLVGMMVIMMVAMLGVNTFALEQVRVRVNGSQVYFPDAQPYVDANSRVLVPVRFVSEQLGAKVDWNQEARRVTVSDGDKEAELVINSKQIKVNGAVKQLDTAAILKGTRTYVPLRFVSEALGASVKWDGKVRIVYIDNGKPPLPEIEVFEAGPFTVDLTGGRITGSTGNKVTTATQMQVGIYEDGSVIILVAPRLRTPYHIICDDAERLLTQIMSQAKAKEIMDYVRTKKDMGHNIGERIYQVGGYTIEVYGDQASVNIIVRPK